MSKNTTIKAIQSDMDFLETPCENCIFSKYDKSLCKEISKDITGIDCQENPRTIFQVIPNPAIKIIEKRIITLTQKLDFGKIIATKTNKYTKK